MLHKKCFADIKKELKKMNGALIFAENCKAIMPEELINDSELDTLLAMQNANCFLASLHILNSSLSSLLEKKGNYFLVNDGRKAEIVMQLEEKSKDLTYQ